MGEVTVTTNRLCSRLSIIESGQTGIFDCGYCVVEDSEWKNRVLVVFDEDEDHRIFSLLNKFLSKKMFGKIMCVKETNCFVRYGVFSLYTLAERALCEAAIRSKQE